MCLPVVVLTNHNISDQLFLLPISLNQIHSKFKPTLVPVRQDKKMISIWILGHVLLMYKSLF